MQELFPLIQVDLYFRTKSTCEKKKREHVLQPSIKTWSSVSTKHDRKDADHSDETWTTWACRDRQGRSVLVWCCMELVFTLSFHTWGTLTLHTLWRTRLGAVLAAWFSKFLRFTTWLIWHSEIHQRIKLFLHSKSSTLNMDDPLKIMQL